MDLRVTVCAKPVPEGGTGAGVDAATAAPDRRGCLVLDDADAAGVEAALRLLEAAGAGTVTVLAMTPATGHAAVRRALAMGAHRALVLTGEGFAGCDALSTAKALAAAAERAGGADVLVAGTESTDGAAGVMPGQLAELLGLPAVTFARRLELSPGPPAELRVERLTPAGWDEVTCPLPCVVTVSGSAFPPRYPSVKGIMGARSKPFEVLDPGALGLPASAIGWSGARQRVAAVQPAPRREAGEIVEDDGSAHERILSLLREWGRI